MKKPPKHKTLHLTSPAMTGQFVRDIQWLLDGNNRHKIDWYKGKRDGKFGKLSGSAAYRAKLDLGFPKKNCTPSAGMELFSYLVGKQHLDYKPLPAGYKRRAKRRAKAAAHRALRLQALDAARKEVGTSESPAGSNRVKYSTWYELIGPWCAMFISWLFFTVSGKKDFFHYAYCPYIEHDATANRNGLSLIHPSQAKPGDLALFHFGENESVHIEMVETPLDENGNFSTFGGNTSDGDGSQSNGGKVAHRHGVTARNAMSVRCFVRKSDK